MKTPRFPAASKKRGMARAVEITEWLQAHAEALAADATARGNTIALEVFKQQAADYKFVAQTLKGEMR